MFVKTAEELGYLGGHFALTLDPSDLGFNDSDWFIEGDVCEDYYEWVNDFKASHHYFGDVFGNFEDKVYASSEEAFNHFFEHHPPIAWDYWDI